MNATLWRSSRSRGRRHCHQGVVGGGHRYADKIGSRVPVIVDANMGCASRNRRGAAVVPRRLVVFLSNGKVNAEALRDMSAPMVKQPLCPASGTLGLQPADTLGPPGDDERRSAILISSDNHWRDD